VLDVNLRGTFIGAREAAKQMIAAGKGGVIINLASTAGFKAGGPGMAHYVASKHGVRGLTKSLAVELGAVRDQGAGTRPHIDRHARHRGPA
jgi:NAD(P)-dependent dehydrogenase (short-subunit alcohol dehydrogenase family)